MCKVHYDVIGKVETSEKDLRYIFQKVSKITVLPDLPFKKPQNFPKMPKLNVLNCMIIFFSNFLYRQVWILIFGQQKCTKVIMDHLMN